MRFAETQEEFIMSFINSSYPQAGIYNREYDLKCVLYWKEFRNKTLQAFDLSLSDYYQYNKKVKRIWREIDAAY